MWFVLRHLLETLCFIEGRDNDWAAMGTYVHGCRGVCGQFDFQHRPFAPYVNEVASVYAEVGFHLDYFRPERLLTDEEMSRLVFDLGQLHFRRSDWNEVELHARFGPPSHQVVGGQTTVACYACEKPGVQWVFFDLARKLPGEDWLPVPLVRDYRRDGCMRLLPLGTRLLDGQSLPTPDITKQA